jgi:NAD(P)-dependent dehydrogenase (short-subunit alcohol dehydrogenase family)
MANYLAGKVVIVTGGSSGFGLETARLLLEQNAQLVITGRNQAKLDAAAADLGGGDNLLAQQADVVSSADWRRLIEATLHRFQRLDVLVNNAGAGVKITPVEEMDDSIIRQVIDTNLTGVILGCREAVKVMKPQQRGLIVNVTSGCCYYSWPNWAIYTAAKSGLVGFTKCLCKEMLEWGGRASLFVPGAAKTNFCDAANLDTSWQAGYPDAKDFARGIVHIVDQPDHCLIQELAIWGSEQVRSMLNPY